MLLANDSDASDYQVWEPSAFTYLHPQFWKAIPMIEFFQEWMRQESVTPVTQIEDRGLQTKSPEINDVTPVTPVTREHAADRETKLPESPRSRSVAKSADLYLSAGYT